MKYIFTFVFLLLVSFCALSQVNKAIPASQQISLGGGRSFHGSGDMRGLLFSVEYGKYVRKRWELSGGFSSTIHSNETLLLLNYPNAETIDASYRSTTAGLQFNTILSFAPVRTKHHEVKVGGGGILRYQSDSYSSNGIYFPPANNFPEPFFTFRNNSKQNTFNAGYNVQVGYTYTFKNNILLGIKAGFQNDTNADVLTNYGIQLGKRF